MKVEVWGGPITASAETLMRQAGYTAKEYLLAAIRDIDDVLGKGFARSHPELIGSYMDGCRGSSWFYSCSTASLRS